MKSEFKFGQDAFDTTQTAFTGCDSLFIMFEKNLLWVHMLKYNMYKLEGIGRMAFGVKLILKGTLPTYVVHLLNNKE